MCPARSYCDGGTATPPDCLPGFYCPNGTTLSSQFPCPIGTFSNTSRLAAAAECSPCTPGMFCSVPGLQAPNGLVAAGYYSGGGAVDSFGRNVTNGNMSPCPTGSACELGSRAPTSCAAGTFANVTGSAVCAQCDSGAYCGIAGLVAPSGLCSGGYWCARGNALPNPTGGAANVTIVIGSNNSVASMLIGGDICPPGSFCRAGSVFPQPCPNGTYNALFGQSSCVTCPAGSYCGQGTENFTSWPCPPGYACPAGTGWLTNFPCPIGTYSNSTGLQSLAQCTRCPAGSYCDRVGATAPTGLCAAGFACLGGAWNSTPTDGQTGVRCVAGQECPSGVKYAAPCSPGSYCAAPATGAVSGPCAAGYFCLQGALTATPGGQNNSYGLIGDICPRGKYCPAGTAVPLDCPTGTWSNATGAASIATCVPCLGGFMCDVAGLALPVKPCPATFYCPNGTISATLPCTAGSFCAGSNAAPTACAAGTYADVPGLSVCKTCPARSYCVAGTVTPATCPAGYVCPAGTQSAAQVACPIGTFSNVSGLANTTECSPCSPGSYCASAGLTAPTGLCSAGFVCRLSASGPSPVDNVTGYACPSGAYCPLGSPAETRCPPGTFANTTRNVALGDCKPCTAGFTCPDAGTVSPYRLCDPGFVCRGGDAAATELCPLANSCARGSAVPVPCPAGTYANVTGLALCPVSPPGYFAPPATAAPPTCMPGFYW